MRVLLLLAALLAASCGADCEKTAESESDCGFGCIAATGEPVDFARECTSARRVFRCAESGDGYSTDNRCTVNRTTGEAFLTSGSFALNDTLFRDCTDAESEEAYAINAVCE